MSDYYDIHGRSITMQQWSAERGRDGGDFQQVKRSTEVEDSTVSTVWLGMDHSWGEGPPLIFESLVFGGGLDQEMQRYSTLAEAHAGHDRLVERVRVEADAFRAIAANPEVAAAVRLVDEFLSGHLEDFNLEDYDGKSLVRLRSLVMKDGAA